MWQRWVWGLRRRRRHRRRGHRDHRGHRGCGRGHERGHGSPTIGPTLGRTRRDGLARCRGRGLADPADASADIAAIAAPACGDGLLQPKGGGRRRSRLRDRGDRGRTALIRARRWWLPARSAVANKPLVLFDRCGWQLRSGLRGRAVRTCASRRHLAASTTPLMLARPREKTRIRCRELRRPSPPRQIGKAATRVDTREALPADDGRRPTTRGG